MQKITVEERRPKRFSEEFRKEQVRLIESGQLRAYPKTSEGSRKRAIFLPGQGAGMGVYPLLHDYSGNAGQVKKRLLQALSEVFG